MEIHAGHHWNANFGGLIFNIDTLTAVVGSIFAGRLSIFTIKYYLCNVKQQTADGYERDSIYRLRAIPLD